MIRKNYVGCCGSCVDCDLGDSYRALYTTTFKCTRYNRSVKADEKGCSKFEPAKNRTNELIAKYEGVNYGCGFNLNRYNCRYCTWHQ